jgi:hypothetical protein
MPLKGKFLCAHTVLGAIRLAVHGTATLYIAIPIGCAIRRGIRRTGGEVCQGAVATPVFGWLRPPNSLCTPVVASRVATAHLNIHR